MFHAKMGSIEHRNGKDLTEAEEIKKQWQEYTEELYRKGLNAFCLSRKEYIYMYKFIHLQRNIYDIYDSYVWFTKDLIFPNIKMLKLNV